ncbi:MAG: nucleotidyltransferase domain-containing protein [Parcubacteria group bacterium]|jgi:predicted nucleotidyltransferase
MELTEGKNWIEELKTALLITSIKGDLRQPHNYAMSRVPARYSRWHTAQNYFYDIERILKELKTAALFVANPPDDVYLGAFETNQEDFIMYHQGYFLDLVHQLKDKLCQSVNAMITYDDKYSKKYEREMKLSRLLKNKNVLRIRGLVDAVEEWDADKKLGAGEKCGEIANALKKRTQYHHFKNPVPAADNYVQTKSSRFLLSPSFQAQLSDYGKQMVEERGKQSFQLWQQETSAKMNNTLEAINNNLQTIARLIVKYYKLPGRDKDGSGAKLLLSYTKLDDFILVKENKCDKSLITPEFRPVSKFLEEELPKILEEELVALYLTGSIARGDFIFGLSDVNLVVILKTQNKAVTDLLKSFINKPALQFNIPIDTKIISEEEFNVSNKLRFICKTDGILLYGNDLLKKDYPAKICFNLAWMLNKDFKDYLNGIKTLVSDSKLNLSEVQLGFLARSLAKRAFRLGFSQIIGNDVKYSSGYKRMLELMNLYYPENRMFNVKMYLIITRFVKIDKENLLALIEFCEKKVMPLYDAIDVVVNGAKNNN